MKIFMEMQRVIAERWAAQEMDSLTFSEIAQGVLEEFAPASSVSTVDLVQWASSAALPIQPDPKSDFGQPPVCVANAGRFMIQVLFWVDGTTSIHQHGFSGAFQVLAGSRFHAAYGFEKSDRVNDHLLLGKLTFREAELLERGATRPIVPGPGFIHALFHLDRPSLTLVARTFHDIEQGPQYEYFKPGLALDPFYQDISVLKRLQLVRFLQSVGDPSWSAVLLRLVRQSSLFEIVQILKYVVDNRLDDHSLEDVLNVVRVMHAQRGELVAAALENRLRERYIVDSRRKVIDQDQRFFLALLLNLERRSSIYETIEKRRVGEDPAAFIVHCLKSISAVTGSGDAGATSDLEMAVLRALLEGKNGASSIIKDLGASFGDIGGYEDEIGRLSAVFRQSPVLRPLFC
jgi:hypothetical protein